MAWSTFWMCVSIAAGVLVAISTWQHNHWLTVENKEKITKENLEHRKSLANQAIDLLKPEIDSNLDLIDKMLESNAANNSQIKLYDLNNSTWHVVSGSEIVLNLESDKLQTTLRSYRAIADIRNRHKRILELSQGVSSALKNANQTRSDLINVHVEQLNSLKTLLEKLQSLQ